MGRHRRGPLRAAAVALGMAGGALALSGCSAETLEQWGRWGLPVAAIWDEIPADSSTAVVERIATRWRELGCDSLVALGGGSVIDTAKAVNILVTLGGERLLDHAGAGCLTRPLKPLAAVRQKKDARAIETVRASGEDLCFLKGRALLGRTARIASRADR